jgi:hypothetical protein
MVPLTGELVYAPYWARETLAAVVFVPLAPYWELKALSGLPTVTTAAPAVAAEHANANDSARVEMSRRDELTVRPYPARDAAAEIAPRTG